MIIGILLVLLTNGLHLNEYGKKPLANLYWFHLNTYLFWNEAACGKDVTNIQLLLWTQTNHTIFEHCDYKNASDLFFFFAFRALSIKSNKYKTTMDAQFQHLTLNPFSNITWILPPLCSIVFLTGSKYNHYLQKG